ncbi:hypothetical protein, partial [Pseudomonas aeruginosa]|uniref:hypothetical protein n=1 Tax=Pseudomonas aeruginosa TaxID=287 RepID=UPI001F28E14B
DMPGASVLDKNRATGLETLFHQGVIGGNQKFAGDSHGKNTENCATFCAPLAKSCALSRSPLGICSLAFYPQRYQPKSCTALRNFLLNSLVIFHSKRDMDNNYPSDAFDL